MSETDARPSWDETGGGRALIAFIHILVLGLLAVPIAFVDVPPLGDYANHLARVHILAAWADSPELRANYAVIWKVSPYLAMDAIVPELARFMSIYTACRVFLYICLLQFVVGTAAVHYALHRKISAWTAVSGLFAYSFVVSLGFVNYMFAIGIWLLSFAGWIVLSRGPILGRVVGGSILSLLVYFSHFFAFFGYALCVGAYELGVLLSTRNDGAGPLAKRAAAVACQFAIPGILVLAASQETVAGVTRYGTLFEKFTGLFSPFVFPGGWLGFAIPGLAIGALMRREVRERPVFAAGMRLPLAALTLAAIAVPNIVSGVWGMNYRLPVAIVFLAIATTSWPNLPRRTTVVLTGVMVTFLAANIALILSVWLPVGRQIEAFRQALAVIPRGARIIAFRDADGIDPSRLHVPLAAYLHLPALAIVERDAYVPILFTNPLLPVSGAPGPCAIHLPAPHVVRLSELIDGADPVKGAAMRGETDEMGMHNYWGGWPRCFDYAIELHFGARPVLPGQLERLASGEIFSIYRISR